VQGLIQCLEDSASHALAEGEVKISMENITWSVHQKDMVKQFSRDGGPKLFCCYFISLPTGEFCEFLFLNYCKRLASINFKTNKVFGIWSLLTNVSIDSISFLRAKFYD